MMETNLDLTTITHPRQVVLSGGPQHGYCHEVDEGWDVPQGMELPDDKDPLLMHRYHVQPSGYGGFVGYFAGSVRV